ncbi:MAG TPA: hypothetical protein PLX15_03170 [Candidatus Woesearchaeota archaeon]|nr:hypothetical protein [Candidatus Woesearchaeota archaeon]
MKSIIVKLVLVVICIFIVVAILLYGLNNITKSIIELTPEFKEKIRMDSVSALDKMCQDINNNFEIPVYYINYVRIEEEFFKGMYYIDFEIKDDGYSEKMLLKTKDKGEIVKSCVLLESYKLPGFTQNILKDNKELIRIGNYDISGEFSSAECAQDTISRKIILISVNKVKLVDYVVKENVDFCKNPDKDLDFGCIYEGNGMISCTDFKEELKQAILYLTNKGNHAKKECTIDDDDTNDNQFKVFFDENEPFETLTLFIYSLVTNEDEKIENFYKVPIEMKEES